MQFIYYQPNTNQMKNHVPLVLLSTLLALFTSSVFAQYEVKPTFFETSDVSNQGIVSGYESWAGPYWFWNPDNNTFEVIGGAAPGNGVGGRAQFSDDGNYLSGTSFLEVPLEVEWERNVLSDYNYIFKAIEFPNDWGSTSMGYAAGQSLTYNGHGIILRSDDAGESWYPMWIDTINRGLEAMSFPSAFVGYVGGWNQYFAKTQNAGWDWEVQNPGGTDDVSLYTGIAFKDENNGVVTAQLENGSAVYVTTDGGQSWTTGSGLAAVPYQVRYIGGDTYFLVSTTGYVQKSTNNGLTWNTVYNIPSALFLSVSFYDEMTGYVLGETYIHKTTNGGATWTEMPVSPITDGALWRDLKWVDEDNLIIVGTPDLVFESNNSGQSWFWSNEELWNAGPALYNISVGNDAINICGSQGNFYRRSRITSLNIAEMSRYDVSAGEWTLLGNLGFTVDNTTSAGYSISGDGNTVVGNSWADPANGNGTTLYAHGVAWNETEGVIDLGSMYAHLNRSSRAQAVSYDGSVIAGLQDFNGPWKSAVWRKNPAGGYFPNEYLLIDPDGSSTDEMNQLGEASAVSGDGNWIGGYGDFAFANPWIWSEATGLVDLGSMGLQEGTIGNVAAINHDGSVIVGWYKYSPDPWTNEFTPFIWTPESGAQDLNEFITGTLGFTMDMGPIYIPNAMSASGRYITGWGLDPNVGPWGELFTFRLDINSWLLGVNDQISLSNTGIYPNPVKDRLNITSEVQIEKLETYNINGQLLLSEEISNTNHTLDFSSLLQGMYIVKVISANSSETFKVIKE
jgi:photosystem II stability/assembly factor-like uncharacterized protein